jgi:hypothetical protein
MIMANKKCLYCGELAVKHLVQGYDSVSGILETIDRNLYGLNKYKVIEAGESFDAVYSETNKPVCNCWCPIGKCKCCGKNFHLKLYKNCTMGDRFHKDPKEILTNISCWYCPFCHLENKNTETNYSSEYFSEDFCWMKYPCNHRNPHQPRRID